MTQVTELGYLFRKPAYPILVDVDGHLIAAKSGMALLRQLAGLSMQHETHYGAIDSSAEGWGLSVCEDGMAVVSPLTMKKRWTKLEVIRLYNSRKKRKWSDQPYSEKVSVHSPVTV